MLINVKALLVVLCLALPMFSLCRPVCLQYMSEEAFRRRRVVWMTLTVAAFLSPTFWLYALIAVFVIVAASSKEENPLATYVLIALVIPNIRVDIPVPFVKQLFDLSQYRLLSLLICVPVALRLLRGDAELQRLRKADVFLILFLLLQVVLTMPYESITATMRRSFLFAIDSFIVFYVFSRLRDREQIAEAIACFWLACALMAPIAVFESARSWLLYTSMSSLWGDPNELAWLMRAGMLRAQASANHSINLGYHLAVAIGLYLYLRTRVPSRVVDFSIAALLAAGLYVTQSRGAWLAAGIIVALFFFLRPHAVRKLPQAIALSAIAIALMYVTPLKESVLDRLPFIGTADQDTVEYRQQLAQVSWSLIQIHPFFGDSLVFLRMESLRQGQGIIDIVNGYLMTALFTGLVGLALMVATFMIAVAKGCAATFRARHDADGALLGASLAACLIGTLVFVATAAYGTTTYILAGLVLSYAATVSREPATERNQPVGRPVRGVPA